MVSILMDQPNTSLRRDLRASGELPSESSSTARPAKKLVPTKELAAVLATVKGTSLRDGLRPPLTVAARAGQSNQVGTRRWPSLVEQGDEMIQNSP
jgi:hypothetical protein